MLLKSRVADVNFKFRFVLNLQDFVLKYNV